MIINELVKTNKVLIFGAGKIGRGFINHLLFLSGFESIFIDKSVELCNKLNSRGFYYVNVMGKEISEKIYNFEAVNIENHNEISISIGNADLIFTAVGGKNILSISEAIANGIKYRFRQNNPNNLNIITCENWLEPDRELKNEILKKLSFAESCYMNDHITISEAVIMRSVVDNEDSDLDLQVQDYWDLPINGEKILKPFPKIKHIEIDDDFNHYLERKIYTFNTANASVSYIGSKLGYKYIADAANDQSIISILNILYNETSEALCKKYNVNVDKQKELAERSRIKLQDYRIKDTLERNARDPIRKLSFNDRLIGAARMMIDHGVEPDAILTAIACALFYTGSEHDPTSDALNEMRIDKGLNYVLENVCGLEPESRLFQHIIDRVNTLRTSNYLIAE